MARKEESTHLDTRRAGDLCKKTPLKLCLFCCCCVACEVAAEKAEDWGSEYSKMTAEECGRTGKGSRGGCRPWAVGSRDRGTGSKRLSNLLRVTGEGSEGATV